MSVDISAATQRQADAEAGSNADSVQSSAHWYPLVLLMLMYACNALDRGIINVVLEPIKLEFGVSDSALGLVAGLAFAISFGLASIPLSMLIDRVDRIRLLAGLMVLWSGLTAVCGLAQSYVVLLIARMGVGAAESGGQPTAVSLISDIYPPNRRASAIGILYVGSSIGAFVSFAIGGLVAATYGWRSAFFVAAIPGVLVALVLVLTVRHPRRGSTDSHVVEPVEQTSLRFWSYLRNDKATLHLIMACILTGAVLASFWTWLASTLMRSHGLDMAQVGFAAAVVGGLCQGFASFFGGWWADRMARTRPANLAVAPAVAQALAAVLGVTFALAPTVEVALAAAVCLGLVSSIWAGPTYALAMNLAPPTMRGRVAVSLQVASGVVGAGLGPVVVGILSDNFGGENSLGYGLASVLSLGLWSCLHYMLARSHAIRRLEPVPATLGEGSRSR